MTRALAMLSRTLLLGLLGLLGACAPARADVFGPIALASDSRTQQVDYAHDPAISGDGRYVAFDGSYGGVSGVWRRDLATGALVQVAPGDAELPSISDDGRFISFTTTASLSPVDQNRAPDVYVRDMDLAIGEEGAFTLASAVTVEGSTVGLAYGYASEPGSPRQLEEERRYGSLASGRSALSGDGRQIVFVTTAASDLGDPQNPSAPAMPPMQVVLRNLETGETRLVSVRRGTSDEPVSAPEASGVYGAVFSAQLGQPQAFAAPPPYGEYASGPPVGASISADGSTVAWLGVNVGQQATLLSGESRGPAYTEPLWRRVAPGSETPTERVTGGSDPSNPACAASGEGALGNSPSLSDPCQGPFATPEGAPPSGIWSGGGEGDFVPRLSGDGYTVAFIARAQLASLGEGFGFGFEGPSDLYVVNMRPGPSRDAALTRLTQLASGNTTDIATDAPVLDFDVSRDGGQVAFTTRRTQFILGFPAYVTAPAVVPGMSELFDADLDDGTLTRVTRGFEGGTSERPHPALQAGRDPYKPGDGALSPSFSADGVKLAFSSTAANLAYGDGNAPTTETTSDDGSDAFVVERTVFANEAAPQFVSAPPAGPAFGPTWSMGVTARSRRDGSVVLYVRVPGAGTLRIGARSAVRVHRTAARRAAHEGHAARASAHAGRHRRRGTGIVTRTVATREARPRGAGLLTITLKLARRYASLSNARGGLSSAVKLTFAAAGHPPLRETLDVTFARVRPHAKAKRSSPKTGSSAAHDGVAR